MNSPPSAHFKFPSGCCIDQPVDASAAMVPCSDERASPPGHHTPSTAWLASVPRDPGCVSGKFNASPLRTDCCDPATCPPRLYCAHIHQGLGRCGCLRKSLSPPPSSVARRCRPAEGLTAVRCKAYRRFAAQDVGFLIGDAARSGIRRLPYYPRDISTSKSSPAALAR